MQVGVHLPLVDFGGEPRTLELLTSYAARAAELGFDMVSGNDHLVFPAPWVDGPMALAAVASAAAPATLATTVYVPALRHPVVAAKALAALDWLAGGRFVVGVGPGSSPLDYAAVGLAFEDRWTLLDEAIGALRALWRPDGPPFVGRHYSTEGIALSPAPMQDGGPPIWIGSWGSPAGLRRVARLGDGWLASAYNIDAPQLAQAWTSLQDVLADHDRDPATFPNTLSTFWFHLADDQAAADRVLRERLAPVVHRPEDVLRDRCGIGSVDSVVDKLAAFRDAGAQRVLLWPVGDEVAQLERFHAEVWPQLGEVAATVPP